tara:strand:+ start:65 stop:178 length:114 start_codon:yes stop_codon:yes gene_type:complete
MKTFQGEYFLPIKLIPYLFWFGILAISMFLFLNAWAV